MSEFKFDDDVVGLDEDEGGLDDDEVKGGIGDDGDGDDDAKDASDALRLGQALLSLAGSSRFSDVTFMVKDVAIPAHRVVLAARSPVFEAMLFPAFDETAKLPLVIQIDDTDPAAFRKMLRCVYTDSANLDADSVQSCLELAKKYQIDTLRLDCMQFLTDDVTVENAAVLFQRAPQMIGDQLFGLEFIEENAQEVFQSVGFTSLSEDRIATLLQSDNLCIDEVDIFRACLRWAAAEIDRRKMDGGVSPANQKQVLANLLPLIRFPVMTMPEVASLVSSSGLLEPTELIQIFTYLGAGDGADPSAVSFNTNPRTGGLSRWQFDSEKKDAHIQIVDKKTGLQARSSGNSHGYILGNKPLSTSSKSFWSMKIDQISGNSWVLAGVSARKVFNQNSYSDPSLFGWASANQGYLRGSNQGAQTNWTQGTEIGMIWDPKKRSLSWINKATKQRGAYPGVTIQGEVVPHFNLYTNTAITVKPMSRTQFQQAFGTIE